MPVWSVGMLSWVPFFRWAIGTRRRRDWVVAGGYLGLVAAALLLGSLVAGAAGGAVLLGLMAAGAVHASILYRTPAGAARLADTNLAAIASAKKTASRRNDARRIVTGNPTLARDLKIGRPDLSPRDYDDGGLVDVNHVPAELLAEHLGWSAAEAAAVVEARERIGGFTSAEELAAYTDLTPGRVDAVADLLLFLRA